MHEFWIILLKLLAVAVLVLLNGFFVAAEFALVKIRNTQLEPLVLKGNRRARLARRLLANVDPYLSACQLGITLASLALGWIGEPVFTELLNPVMNWVGLESGRIRHGLSVLVGFSLITFLHIVVGEQAPKFLAIKRALPSALWVAYPLEWFYRLSFPFIWVLNIASLRVLSWLGIGPSAGHGGEHTEDELRLMVAERTRDSTEGILGREIVLNAFDLRRRIVRDVMRPRNLITALSTTASLADCLAVAEQSRYSRFPLCIEGNLDRARGVVHCKDLFSQREQARTGSDLLPIARQLIYVPETARLEKLLGLFLERRLHFALVVDEYGGTTGMVTLENCLEELVGQIQDEFDQEKPLLVPRGANEWDIDGALPLFELGELVGATLPDEGVSTVSGWVTQRLGGFPKRGDVLPVGKHELRVEELDGLRVARLRLQRAAPAPDEPTSRETASDTH